MAMDTKVVARIWQILQPYGSRGLTPAQVYDALKNLRGRTTQPAVSRYLSKHAHKRRNASGKPILGTRKGHLFTKPVHAVSETQVAKESMWVRKTAEKYED